MYSAHLTKPFRPDIIRALRRHYSAASQTGFSRYDGPIVISGISGRFPNASNTSELTEKLLSGVELTSETAERWDDQTLPKRFGFLHDLDRFDAGFFRIPARQAQEMDPQTRLLLEVAFEAIIDAGINPVDFRGSRTGVFCGAYGQESYDHSIARVNMDERGYFVAATTNYMIPGRIAFHLDLRGPSTKLCTACSSSFTALETAILSIQGGKCEAAIVTGSNVHLNNLAQKNLMALNALAPDGRCKAFDESADGFVRSEAAVGILVQKEQNARRNYARIRSIRSNTDGFKNAGVTHPDRHSIANIMKETYEECGVDPSQVSYVEAHGTGTPAGDPEEFHAIHKVFCQGPTVRNKPLLVGSVKSNLGHTECAAGLSGVAKVIGAVQTGTLPGNLFFNKPNPEIEPLLDGTVEIVTQPTPFDRGIVGICSSGIGGTNYHVVLEPGPITDSKHEHQLPVIVSLSGRSEAQVENSIVQALENASNPEYVNLLQAAFQRSIPGHHYKGYGLHYPNAIKTDSTISVERCDVVDRPVWAVFPGMGAQWNGMGKDLMRIEPFAHSISQSRATLGQLGVDLDELLAKDNGSIFTNIHHAFLSIAAMQIALWDTMCALQIKAEGFIGHSAGEGLCAYADGCLSAEETLLVADARGRAIRDHQKVVGGMVAVGMSANNIKPRLPPGVQIACENTAENVTLSGELELVTRFAEQLKAEGTFTSKVNSCGVALHSQHVWEAAQVFKSELKSLIKGDRVRGPCWVSTSVPEAEWDSGVDPFASAEYFGNNVAKPVLFSQALEKIPAGSLVIEISPKGFFQSLLNEALPADCVHVSPMTIKAKDNLLHFFHSVGKMYTCGASLKMEKLYPPVSLPVSSNTPSISPLVQWDHSVSWKTGVLPLPADLTYESVVNLDYPEYAYLAGHKIDKKILMPATGYLHSIWMQFAENFGRDYQNFPVRFRDVAFKHPTLLSHDVATKITNFFQSTTGVFHIESGGELVVSGTIERLLEETEEDHTEFLPKPDQSSSSSAPVMFKDDFYKELRLRGYNFSGDFQSIQAADSEGKWADIVWKENWTCFLDAMLQSAALESNLRNLVVPVDVECITIDPIKFKRHLQHTNDNLVRATSHPNQKLVVAPGIAINGLHTGIIPQTRDNGNLAYESYSFSPFLQQTDKTPEAIFSELIDLVLDNATSARLQVFDVFQNPDNSLAFQFQKVLSTKPSHEYDVSLMTISSEAGKIAEKFKTESKPNILIKFSPEELAPDVPSDLVFLDEPQLLVSTSRSLKEGGFVLVQSSSSVRPVEIEDLCLVSQKRIGNETMSLFRKVNQKAEKTRILQVSVDQEEFQWVPELQEALASDDTCRIYLTSQGTPASGILGLTNCLRREENGNRIRCIFDPEGELNLDFQQPDARLQSIISLDLAVNVLHKGQLGSYRHVLMSHAKPDTDTVALKDAYVGTLTPGDLSSLRWIEFPAEKFIPGLASKSYSDVNTYTVAYAALNFRDVLLASRTIPLEYNYSYKGLYMGQEFSGFDEKGTRVMGTADGVGMATKIFSKPNFITQVPDHWTLEEAATVPIVYYTVLYALHMRARIQPDETVLVHAGSGGVGQAAISVALAQGCRVFTTVGTPEKRDFIKRRFPQIPDDHIGNSRDTSFKAQFMEVTNGIGVDVILNSLAGEKLKASLKCLAMHGKFLEIGVADAYMNTEIGMRPFLKNIDFSAVELQHIMRNPGKYEPTLQKLLEDGIRKGSVTPLPTHIFEQDQVEEAFRFMAKGLHTGKVAIKIRDTMSDPLRIQASRRTYFSKDKTYLIAGGLGGLGLEVANWMVERGVEKLILTSRSGPTNSYQLYCLEKWRKAGAVVQILTADLSDRKAAEDFLANAASNGVNLGGIINSTIVLRDDPFPQQTVETFKQVSAPKAEMTAILDELSRKYYPQLDIFVVFSSFSCGRGNPDQANYGWANSVMERICEKRKADGFHGLAIQWGLVGQVGVIAEKIFKGKDDVNLSGTTFQSIQSCLEVLDKALLQSHSAVVSSGMIADKRKRKGERGGLMQRLQKIFGIADFGAIDPQRNLNELGMDSIVAVELKQTLEREYDVSIKKDQLAMLTVGDLRAIGDGTFDGSSLGNRRGAWMSHGEDIYTPFQLHDKILVRLKSHETSRQVFIVHGGDGASDNLRPLAAKLLANVHAFQLTRQLEWNSIAQLAAHYVFKIKEEQPAGPYTILAYSSGATIAFQMAQQLELEGQVVQQLVLLDGYPNYADMIVDKSYALGMLKTLKLDQNISQDRLKTFEAILTGNKEENISQLFKLINEGTGMKIGQAESEAYKKLYNRLGKHIPQGSFRGEVHILQAADSWFKLNESDESTGRFCVGPVTRHKVSGTHWTFLLEAHVEESANIINSLLLVKA